MIPNSYWVIPGALLVGPYPGSTDPERVRQKIEVLRQAGIQRIVNLCVKDEFSTEGTLLQPYLEHLPASISVRHFPIHDGDRPSRTSMSNLLDHIDECLWSNVPVYLHCRGGKRRTGTVVACFLTRHAIAAGPAAIEMNARLRSFHGAVACQLTAAQAQLVLEWRQGE